LAFGSRHFFLADSNLAQSASRRETYCASMSIADILTPDMVLPDLSADSKNGVLRELAAKLCAKRPTIKVERLTAVLIERERLGSTAIGDGIAIPHGKIQGITSILGVFGRSLKGVDFDSLDGKPTHLFFLLVAPEEAASLHLKALARVSRLLRNTTFREQLMSAPDSAEIYRLIKEEDEKY
jgi:PTS system nitrogen regulatory IIA component